MKKINKLLNDTDLDNLTRIYNDFVLENSIISEINKLILKKRFNAFAIILFDIDNSKQIRRLGIDIKIKIIKKIINYVRKFFLDKAFVYGHGTRDDIVIILPIPKNNHIKEYASQQADLIRTLVNENNFMDIYNENFRISMSGGISVFPTDSINANDLFLLAEGGCRKAKENGRNRCEFGEMDLNYIITGKIYDEFVISLNQLSISKNVPISTLLRESFALLFQRHAGLERFCKGINQLR